MSTTAGSASSVLLTGRLEPDPLPSTRWPGPSLLREPVPWVHWPLFCDECPRGPQVRWDHLPGLEGSADRPLVS